MLPKYRVQFQPGFSLTEILEHDQEAYVRHMLCKTISDNTSTIPFPYSNSDAKWWVERKVEETKHNNRPVTFAIRDQVDRLVGTVGFDGMFVGKDFKAELGYWLAEEYWGKGLMSSAVQSACIIGFEDLGLVKISAHVFSTNIGSRRVLEKCGFEEEGYLKKHERKDGKFIDSYLFALLKS